MEEIIIRVLQFVLAISLLVLLHEGGHFFFSKLFGVRVEKFFIFFDLGIGKWNGSLFSFKPKKSNTTYGMGWLPLGGYCKISGMIDESFDTEQMKQPAQPWEFRSKPAWQRLLIMIGGVLVNFLLALIIYAGILFTWGDQYVALKDMSHGMKFNEEAKTLGFKDGDILLGTDQVTFKDFGTDLYRGLSEAKRVDIIRNGRHLSMQLPGNLNLLNMIKDVPPFVRPLIPSIVADVIKGSPAAQIGMKKGDKIVALNNTPVDSWQSFEDVIGVIKDQLTAAKTRQDSTRILSIKLTIQHAKDTARVTRSLMLTNEATLGVSKTTFLDTYRPTVVEYGFFESIPAGINYGIHVLKSYVDDLKYVFTKDGAKSLGGFGTIGSMFPTVWDWYTFWKMTAFLSIILAFMNILPIPALDGGHVLFLLYEIVTRRKPSENFMIKAEYVGFIILILLMILANMNDILRWLGYMN